MMRFSTLPARLARTGCSVLALATVLVVGASPAAAQSFLGTGTYTTNPNVTGITTGPGTTTINLNPGQTVIDWIPTDNATGGGAIGFQLGGTTATFTGASNFAVLNNINQADMSRAISMNGTINSLVGGVQGGSVYFYSPGGFVLGQNSLINVGSLVLSASPITLVGGSFINGASNAVVFGQAPNTGSSIITTSGSQINANVGGAYTAMVAPRVQHGGSITVNGSAALVGAEAATINFSPTGGLFDIQVTTGTTDANGVVSSGSITGPAGGIGDIHRVYMVAIPKNAALTMVITQGGSLGFDVADAADVVGNTVVLSAGYDIAGGSIQSAPAAAGNGFRANLSITGATMTSALVAAASGTADIFSPLGQSSNFASDVTMRGVDRARVGASGFTTTVNIAGNLDLSTATNGTAPGQDVTSGLVEVYALQNASVSVTGSTTLNTNASGGGSSTANLQGGDAIGGDVNITAQTGGDVMLSGGLVVTASGYGGYGAALNAPGGNATGGDVVVSASGVGSSIATGSVAIAADGLGGSGSGLECFSCNGDGGIGTGGTVDIRALAGGILNLSGVSNSISTGGVGGYSGRSDGGNAFGGGLTRIYADGVGSLVTTSGSMNISANATGGDASIGTGGNVEGGDIDIFAQNGGSLQFGTSLTAAANGTGGAGALGGGDAFGGSVSIFSTASLRVDGALNASANATGGYLYASALDGNSAGNGFGGVVDAYAQNGALTLVGAVYLSTNAVGGQVGGSLDLSGDGVGGTTRLFARASGVIDLQSTLNATAIGSGGGSDYYSSGIGGDGLGGAVRVQATAANASITIADAAILDASGEGSGSSGGNGTGGTAWADSFGAASASLSFLSDVTLYAQGVGGDHNNANGGRGQGGQALLQASAGSTVSVGGDAIVNTDAFGGYTYDFSDGVGGNATGGESRIQTFGGTGTGGTIAIDGDATVTANGSGGDSYSNNGGTAGNGTGGSAHVITTLGNITIGAAGSGDGVEITANGYGGDSNNGFGGDGTGGTFAILEATNGDITIEGYASVSASGYGGDGLVGGDGLGSGTPPTDTAPGVGGAHVIASNGDIVIKGGVGVSAVGSGGNGGDGNYNNGYDGDYGGNGTGGWASIHATNRDIGPSSITIISGAGYKDSGSALVNVSGTGGDGGIGGTDFGGDGGGGGDGGIGRGGNGSIFASAGNGTVTIAVARVDSQGIGGAGGTGGTGFSGGECFECDGDGGNGGIGGDGFGGQGAIGTQSGNGQSAAVNLGLGDYGTISIDSSAFGGFGGGGGSSNATGGGGGNGGHATGGNAVLLVRGSTVNVVTATLAANATGGDAGDGYQLELGIRPTDGIGGNATVGGGNNGIRVLVTDRFLIPAHLGTLNAGDITGTAIATGGIGFPDGNSTSLGGSGVVFRNSDGNIGSLDFTIGVGSNASTSGVDSISVINGDVLVDGAFSFVTDGNLSLFANNGDMHASILTLSAGNFVFDPVSDPPSNRGTYFADSATITTENNFVTSANLDIGSNLSIVAPGLINAANMNVDGNLYLEAQSGLINLLNLTATDDIELVAFSDILVGNATAGETIDLAAGGSIDGGNMTAGDSVYAEAGGSISLDNVSAGLINRSTGYDADYDVGILAGTTIDTGNIAAFNSIGVAAAGNINTGNINAGNIFLALGGGNMGFGSITTGTSGQVYLANFSMMALGGEITNNFDPLLILNANPVASGGSIAISGPLTTGLFRASAGTSFLSGNITSTTNILIDSGSNMTLGNLIAGLNVSNVEDDNAIRFNSGGSIVMGNAIARDGIDFDANGSVTGGNLTSGRSVSGSADGAIILGNLSGGIVNASGLDDDGFSVGMSSGTSVTVGNVIGAESVGFASLGSVTTGTINAANDFLVMATGNMSFGAITVGGRVYLADSSMYLAASEGGDGDEFDAALVFAANPIASAGSITAGAINAGSVQAAAGTTFNVGTIVANGRVALSSGGAMQTQAVTAGTSLRMTSGSTINGGNLTAGTLARVSATGAVNVGNITITNNVSSAATNKGAVFDVGIGPPVEVFGASIATGNIATPGYVGLYTPGSLTVGTITAGHDVIALVGTNAAFGAIKTPERFFLGGYSMFALANGGESFNPAAVFGAPKAKTGGTASFAGASTAASFQAYVGTDTTLQSLQTSSFALIDTGGMFTLNGTLGGDSRVISNDIALGAASAINGEIHLISRNATQTLIGDGLDALGQGYRLSDAEADRINAVFTIAADTASGAAAKMIIGDLSINVAASVGRDLEYGFGTVNGNADAPSVGSIRVVGDVTFTGLDQFDEVAFDTNLFQLDAATGSIALFGTGTTLGGTLGLYAPRIWVASGDILAKLEANSTYAGYIAELNAPAAVQRPEGVLRAGSIDVDSGGEALQSLLVQNTGTTALPAGFLTTTADIDGEDNIEPAAGSVNLVINGQLITAGATLTGLAVRDFLVTEFGSAAFVAGSTINGCVLVGPCGTTPPTVNTLVATDIQLTDNVGLGDGLFGNEPDIDDGESGDEGDRSSPIAPPNPLFDSRPLVQSGDVDDPVSGAGNPSLYDDTSDEDAKAEDCDSSKDNNCKTGKKGDGK